jgi:tetratricopeptide (TPR) repeat protein
MKRAILLRVSQLALLLFPVSISCLSHLQIQQRGRSTDNNVEKTSEARSVVGQAEAAAASIKNAYQRGFVLDPIGAVEAKVGDLNAAVETACRAYPNDMATLTAIGEQLVNQNDSGKALTIMTKLNGGQSSTVLAFMARRQSKYGKVDEALRITEQIQVPEVRSDARKWIAQQQAARGDYSEARKTLALAKAAYPAGRSTPDDVQMIIAEGQLTHGEIEAARTTISSMKSADSRSATMISGAEILLDKGDRVNAPRWLEDATRKLPPGSSGDLERYLSIPLQVKLSQKDRAMQTADALPQDTRLTRLKGYGAVAVACAEAKDVVCVNSAMAKMQLASSFAGVDKDFSEFEMKLLILNVTAALFDNGEFETASRLLRSVEQHLDDSSRMSIESEIQMQRVFALAQQGRFDDARSLAMKIHPNRSPTFERETALRMIALLQTKKSGVASSHQWTSALADPEDRAYALLGIAQALLEIDDVSLHYSAIQIH